MFFYIAIIILVLVAVINIEFSSFESMGLGGVVGMLSTMVVLIVQYYFRKSPPTGK